MAAKTEIDYLAVTPQLVAHDATRAIDFYVRAFGAVERYRIVEPGGKIGHAEIAIGDAIVALSDEYPEYGALSPASIGGSPMKLLLKVDDCDAVVRRAIEFGATELRPVKDQFYGDRSGAVIDPFGFTWTIATHKEVVSPEEMQRRFTEMMKG
jgi:PhnB protein